MPQPIYRDYLFSYRFEGSEWGFEIKARSAAEAHERLKAIALARYDGELIMTIPAGLGWFARTAVWLRNAFKA